MLIDPLRPDLTPTARQPTNMKYTETNDTPNAWNRDSPYDVSGTWLNSKPYISIINQRLTGTPHLGWFEHAVQNYMLTESNEEVTCLLLGSNEGHMEIKLREMGFNGRIVASDIADKALARAKKKIEERNLTGIEHIQSDLNKKHFDREFDFIIAEGVLHHIENAEFCIAGLEKNLKPGGKLIAMEFLGPFRFQLPEVQVRWINAALSAVPRKFRPLKEGPPDGPPLLSETVHNHYVHPTVEEMLAFDPSEAVSGYKLPGLFENYFSVEMRRFAGGCLIPYMAGHFPFDDTNTSEECRSWLEILAHIEWNVAQSGVVPHEFSYWILGKKNTLE